MASGGNNFNDFPECIMPCLSLVGVRAGSAPSKYAHDFVNYKDTENK